MGGDKKKEVGYENTQDPAWAKEVNAWAWSRRDDEEAVKSSPCPRCGHRMSVIDSVGLNVQRVMAAGARPQMLAYCNCGVEHDGAPEGRVGCGASGLIDHA